MTYLRVAQLLDSVRHRFSNIGAVSETGGENNRYDFLSRGPADIISYASEGTRSKLRFHFR